MHSHLFISSNVPEPLIVPLNRMILPLKGTRPESRACTRDISNFVKYVGLYLAWYALLCALSSFAIILTRKRKRVALHLLSFGCLGSVNTLWLFLKVSWIGLQCVIVVILTFILSDFSRIDKKGLKSRW